MKTFIIYVDWYDNYSKAKVVLTDPQTLEQFVVAKDTKVPILACVGWLEARDFPARILSCVGHPIIIAQKLSKDSPVETPDNS